MTHRKQASQSQPTAFGRIPGSVKMLISVGIVLLVLLVSFRVQRFEIRGNDHYSETEVANASGVTEGDILMAINKAGVAGKLLTKLPFLEEVRIEKQLPGIVRISVKECTAAAICESEYFTYWLISDSGKLLEEIDEDALAEYRLPVYKGVKLVLPTLGAQAEYSGNVEVEVLYSILDAIRTTKLSSQISEVNLENPAQITLLYDNRITIQIGNGDRAAYKLQYFLGVADQIPASKEGILDLTFSGALEEQAIFHPYG